MWGDCIDDAISHPPRHSSGGNGAASSGRYSLAAGHELSEARLELDSTGDDPAIPHSGLSVLIEPV